MYGPVCLLFGTTNNNGFWIARLDLLALLLQLQPIITAHNQWLSKTRSISYWPTSVFSPTVTNDERRITPEWILLSVLTCAPFITSGESNRDHLVLQFICYSFFNRYCGSRCPVMDYSDLLPRKLVLASRYLGMDYLHRVTTLYAFIHLSLIQ
jgi:hypothetical protein